MSNKHMKKTINRLNNKINLLEKELDKLNNKNKNQDIITQYRNAIAWEIFLSIGREDN